jgi:hypothetical protein
MTSGARWTRFFSNGRTCIGNIRGARLRRTHDAELRQLFRALHPAAARAGRYLGARPDRQGCHQHRAGTARAPR